MCIHARIVVLNLSISYARTSVLLHHSLCLLNEVTPDSTRTDSFAT